MLEPGSAWPVGPHHDGRGTNFCVFSEVADRVDLCLFDAEGRETQWELPGREGPYFHGYAADVGPGQRYGFRVHGPYVPGDGHRCNPAKLLLDPYARAVAGRLTWDDSVFGFAADDPFGAASELDSAGNVPRSLVVDSHFDWGGVERPHHAWSELIIYELHVKSFTATHPDVPPALRGTYAGLAHPAAIEHLTSLGVTAVELMPVHQFEDDAGVRERGLSNYWGYGTLAFFAPHAGYSSVGDAGGQVPEFKAMVQALHRAGIEVILDVVYNHTCEGSENGPTLCFRGFDNRSYYKRAPRTSGRYLDHTGCGNTLQSRHPQVLQLVLDSLRYWATEMHVDGFRFDLAPALARTTQWVDRYSAFLGALQQDPSLQGVKLIAEPWDLGSGGYQLGQFPARFSEWNGRYRDSVREFWCKGPAGIGELARRFSGSADLFRADGRRPHSSVNFVTAHDGFTLNDLLTYSKKRNLDNNEDNRDGESHNRGWNCGAEGLDAGPEVLALRARQKRNFLLTLLFSQGVPMLLSGDELGRTQQGNNNAYCHDGPINWLDWSAVDSELLSFVREAIALSTRHAAVRPDRWFDGEAPDGGVERDVRWHRPDGEELGVLDWDNAERRTLGVLLTARRDPGSGSGSEPGWIEQCLVLLNAETESVDFILPRSAGQHWLRRMATDEAELGVCVESGSSVAMLAHSAQVYLSESPASPQETRGDGTTAP